MKKHFIPALKLTLLTMVVFGVAYPLLITGIAQFFPGGGRGVVVEEEGKIMGFEVIGQKFSSEKYFNSRPSAVDYNAAATGGSNKGPTNPDYLALVEERIKAVLSQNPGIERKDIPVDLVTASGGGLDPHISLQAALIQVDRIARVRNVSPDVLKKLIADNTENEFLGIAGTKNVHVLRLNLALDKLKL